MKTRYLFRSALLAGLAIIGVSSCNVDPEFYSQVVPDNYYQSQNAVWQRFARPFTHWRWYAAHNENLWRLQELGTDEFCIPTRGSDWFNGGVYQKFHHHEYTEDMTCIQEGWRLSQMGVALSWDALEDLQQVDFKRLGFAEGTQQSMLSQLQTLVAWFYLKGLDLFGGMPLCPSTPLHRVR